MGWALPGSETYGSGWAANKLTPEIRIKPCNYDNAISVTFA